MIVVCTAESAEQALTEGQLVCPRRGCGDTLQRWGYGRRRHVRNLSAEVIDVRLRRVRCRRCRPPMFCCRLHCSHAGPMPPR